MIRKASKLIERTGRKALVDGDVAALAREVGFVCWFYGDGTMLQRGAGHRESNKLTVAGESTSAGWDF